MAHRHLLFRTEAREKLLHGASALADAIRLTIGPKAKCVLIQKKWGKPIVCDDGVTIAKEFDLKDPEENLGAQVIREAAEKTGDAVGDGTSTATILAYAIYSEGLRNIAAGASAVDLKRGLDRGLRAAVDSIKSLSRPVSSKRERAQVATVSAHNHSELGELVADAMEKVGSEGVVSVEEAKGTEISVEVVEGMQVDRGYLSPYTAPVRSQTIVEFMRNSSSYPDNQGPIEVVETHISWIFLTDRYAYKLKKPVRFEFLDFSTTDLRHRACLDEVQLNRRLAPDVYLGSYR